MAANILTQTISTISAGGAVCRAATTSSKRTFLRGAAAIAAAAIPAGAALASETNPDAALLALQPEIDAADQAWEARYWERAACEEVYFAIRPDKPETTLLDNATILMVLTGKIGLSPEAAKAIDIYAEAMGAWRKAIEQARDDTGLTAAEKAQNAASDVVVTIRATTLAGLIFKARFAASHFPGDPDEDVMRSIVEDLLAMPGELSDG